MPESPSPPTWGPADDERALEALLSGQAYRIPEALAPVAVTIDALRSAPLRGELSGEDAARAAFRAAAAVPVPVPVPVPWADGAEHGTVTARTLVLPPGDRGQRGRARHRRRKTGTRAVHRPLAVVTGAVGVAVLAVAVALTGVLPGAFAQSGNRTAGASGSASSTASSTTQRVEGAGSKEPAFALRNPGELCREYYSFVEHAESPSSFAAEAALRSELNALVGNPVKVFAYCVPYLGYLSVGKASGSPTASPSDSSSGGVGATATPVPKPGKGNSGSGKSRTGNSGSANPGPANSAPANPAPANSGPANPGG